MTPDTGLRYPPGTDYRPRANGSANGPSAEWCISYRCNLTCSGCNRGSFLREPHTADMTIADAQEFCRQARELDWRPRLVIIGGEPTLHPLFTEFVDVARDFMGGGAPHVWSNGYSARSRDLLQIVTAGHGASVNPDTHKPTGSVREFTGANGWVDDIYVSPSDFGEPLRLPCYQHSSIHCGVSVDHEGYSPCAMGGALDALLGAGVRTKTLADLFDVEKMATMTAKLCAHCGHQRGKRENVAVCERRFEGTPMSPTWVKAFEGRR